MHKKTFSFLFGFSKYDILKRISDISTWLNESLAVDVMNVEAKRFVQIHKDSTIDMLVRLT